MENGTIRKFEYGPLFAFHSNYGPILYHFRDKARYRSKIAIFHIPCIGRPRQGGHRRNIAITFGTEETEWCGQSTVKKKFDDMFSRFDTITACDGRTDRRADILRHHSPRYAQHRAVKTEKTEIYNSLFNNDRDDMPRPMQ